jgi:hypothetical protein
MHGALDRVEQERDARVTAASASVTRPISLLLLPPYVSSYYHTCVLVLVYMCGWSGSGCVVRSVETAACRAESPAGVLGQCRSWCTSISERGRFSCRSAGAVCSAGSSISATGIGAGGAERVRASWRGQASALLFEPKELAQLLRR